MNSTDSYKKTKIITQSTFRTQIYQIWESAPLFIKFYLITTFSLYILNIIFNCVPLSLSNIPLYTIYHFQIYRLITTVFMTTSIFQIILGLLCWIKSASSLEYSLGTIKYVFIFVINTIFIQILYCFLSFIFSLFINSIDFLSGKIQYNSTNNSSIWGTIMCEMTLLCISNPEISTKLLFFPCTVKAKAYPLLLFILNTIFNFFRIDLEVICGFLYGILYYYILRNYLLIPDTFIVKIEELRCLKWLINSKSFIGINRINNCIPVPITNTNASQVYSSNKGGYVILGKKNKDKEEENNQKASYTDIEILDN